MTGPGPICFATTAWLSRLPFALLPLLAPASLLSAPLEPPTVLLEVSERHSLGVLGKWDRLESAIFDEFEKQGARTKSYGHWAAGEYKVVLGFLSRARIDGDAYGVELSIKVWFKSLDRHGEPSITVLYDHLHSWGQGFVDGPQGPFRLSQRMLARQTPRGLLKRVIQPHWQAHHGDRGTPSVLLTASHDPR